MDERDGYYFHRSFWESIELMNAKDQLALFKAITVFALNGTEPEKLTSNQKASWVLIRPVLAKGRNKAANGKKGGSKKEANGKQTESKSKSVSDLPLSDKGLGSNPKGLRQGTSDEGVNERAESAPQLGGKAFTSFWEDYPWKMNREEAWNAWKELNPDLDTVIRIMTGLEAWKKSERWTEDGGRFIPAAAKFLREKDAYWGNPPQPTVKKPQQGYVHGADRLLEMLERGDFDDET